MWIDYDDGHAGGYPHDCPDTELCRYCDRPLVKKYTNVAEHLAWGHVSQEAAADCPSRQWAGVWPEPRLAQTPNL